MLRKEASSEDRRTQLLQMLRESNLPVKAADLAKATGVSRQVIVQDIALLRAKQEPIIATSQGYIYSTPDTTPVGGIRQVIYTQHTPAEMEKELNILVDHGVTVLDVGIEHPVYGKIFRPLGLKTRYDVKTFTAEMARNQANLLSELTNGRHSHTVEAPDDRNLERARQSLAEAGFLLET